MLLASDDKMTDENEMEKGIDFIREDDYDLS